LWLIGTLKADFQSSHEAPRSSLRMHAWALSSNHNAKQLILIRCKHSQRATRSFVRGLEIRLYTKLREKRGVCMGPPPENVDIIEALGLNFWRFLKQMACKLTVFYKNGYHFTNIITDYANFTWKCQNFNLNFKWLLPEFHSRGEFYIPHPPILYYIPQYYICCTTRQNSWKIIAFNYITMNFRNMYCRYVVLHFVSFDLM
jgi:hypothetical protein